MASGVSGRVSVSPANDEVYQSPGASQDDGIDHMLAQYTGLVGRRPGDGEEAVGEGERAVRKKTAVSGRETGMHIPSKPALLF